jgi:8-amino-7-oxononanoate synthase
MGCHGAIVVGSELLRKFLINFSRSFIYTTALPVHSLISIHQSYELLQKDTLGVEQLYKNIQLFKKEMASDSTIQLIESDSPIQSIIISGNEAVKKCSDLLRKKGLDVRPILSPTVPKEKERLRICIHAFNTTQEMDQLIAGIQQAHQQLM